MNPTSPSPRPRYFAVALLTLAGLSLVAIAAITYFTRTPHLQTIPVKPPAAVPPLDTASRQKIEHFCSACHRLPEAIHFPKAAWHHEVQRGFQFYNDSGRTDLDPPPLQTVVAYYQSAAPERLVIPTPAVSSKPTPVKFRQARFPTTDPGPTRKQVAISSINWLHRTPGQPGELFYSDMRRGEILKIDLGRDALQSEVFATIPHPAAIRTCDLDGDGQTELVVADLGSFFPEDHDRGKVWWFQPDAKPRVGKPILAGIGRVTDVQPVDADGDGDQDLLAAEFGWHKTGGIHLLENQGLKEGQVQFARHKLDARPGTIHLSVTDLNGDQQPDFVALISQEHESTVAFLNRGSLKFEAKLLGEALDPSSGSSGMTLVDLDRDNDLDLLVTNGDSFDSYYLKPSHSVFWLENRGNLNFERHHITYLPGAHRALAGDMDGDGDLDIVAAASLPKEPQALETGANFDSLILLEQVQPGQFVRHRLEVGECYHTALELADFDDDGDLDLAVANFSEFQVDNVSQLKTDNLPPLTVWWNLQQD